PAQLGEPIATELSDRWMISRYHQVIKQTSNYIDNYGLGEAAKGLYEFFWGDFCDWYIELVKSRLQKDADPASRKVAQQILGYVLEGILKLLHPLMPHITEEIWQTLTQQPADSLQILSLQLYPEIDNNLINPELEAQFDLLIGTIRTIRNLRAEADIKPGAKITANLQTDSLQEQQILTAGQAYIQDLAKVENLTIACTERSRSAGVQEASIPEEISPTVVEKKPQRGLKTIGLIIVGFVFARIGLVAGNTVYQIPVIGTFFEIVGLGYTSWFVVQILLKAEARQKFWAKFFPPTPPKAILQTQLQQPQAPENAISGVVGTVQVVIPLSGDVVDIATLRAKLEKTLNKVEAEAKSLSARLSNAKFVDKAPADVVEGVRESLTEAEKQAQILRDRLSSLL
ncbi:class I tRNA ligase family protein, partial [Nodularia sphaerocarpa]